MLILETLEAQLRAVYDWRAEAFNATIDAEIAGESPTDEELQALALANAIAADLEDEARGVVL